MATQDIKIDVTCLFSEFAKICPDILENVSPGIKNDSIRFAIKVLWYMGKEFNLLNNNAEYEWKFKFSQQKECIVRTNKRCFMSEYSIPTVDSNGQLILTMKQVTIVALKKFCELLTVDPTFRILTPVAETYFYPSHIDSMIKDFEDIGYPISVVDLLKEINTSCYWGGPYLSESSVDCALALIHMRNDLHSDQQRFHLIDIVFEAYQKFDKPYNFERFEVFIRYANRIRYLTCDMMGIFEKIRPERIFNSVTKTDKSRVKPYYDPDQVPELKPISSEVAEKTPLIKDPILIHQWKEDALANGGELTK